MYLPLALALMTAMALVMVIAPLMRSLGRAPGRPAYDRTIYRDQLQELERDRARGLIGEVEVRSARIEIERRMLAADRRGGDAVAEGIAMPKLALLLALLVACGAGGIYLAIGSPGVPDQPTSGQTAAQEAAAQQDLQATADDLQKRLATDANDGEGWALLGQTEAQLGNWDKAADAYRHAVTLAPADADTEAAYGETLVLAASGVVTPTAAQVFHDTLSHDPTNGVARYYLALADAQAGHTEAAIAAWQKLASESPANSPVRVQLEQRIDQAASDAGITPPTLAPPAPATATAAAAAPAGGQPGPDAAQMAAAANMTPEQRQAMIRAMVGKLAAQLQSAPNNLNGWMQLARAYGVLGERDHAADAFDHAAALDPKNVTIPLTEIDALLGGDNSLDQDMPPRVVALLKKAQALSPNEPEVLWYLGLYEAQQKQPTEAAGYWQRLLASLPADAPERATVSQALASLKTQ